MSAKEADLANNPDQPKKKKRRWIIALILLLLITLVGVFVFAPQGTEEQPVGKVDPQQMEDRGFGEDGELDMTNAESIRAGVQQRANESMLELVINQNPIYSNGVVNWMLENPNENGKLLQVDIFDDEKVIYQSPTLKPNQKVQTAKVNLSNLKSGNHRVRAEFNFYDEASKKLYISHTYKGIILTINDGGKE